MASDRSNDSLPHESNDVVITPVAVRVPLGRILLVRRNLEYCAVKFTRFWTGKTAEDLFAAYESYHQGDKTGNFLNKNVQVRRDELSFPKPRGIGRLAFSFGNKDVRCGSIRLFWFGQGWVYFYGSNQKEGDYGIELAPSKWTDIGEVNVVDAHLKWYRYDAKRQEVRIPVDRLLDEDGK